MWQTQSDIAQSHSDAWRNTDMPDEVSDAKAWEHAIPWCNSEYVLFRPTPLRTPYNQGLVNELQLLRKHRRLSNDEQSEMAYMRAAASIKAVPFPVNKLRESALRELKGVGRKMATVIAQYFELGRIAEAETIRHDDAVRTVMQFNELYGIGPKNAERAYNDGCRTLQDLTLRRKTQLSNRIGPRESLRLLPELEQRISRAEVAHIALEIVAAAEAILPGCSHTITGGYRRGKEDSGDVDLVLALPRAEERRSPRQVLHELIGRLQEEGWCYAAHGSHQAKSRTLCLWADANERAIGTSQTSTLAKSSTCRTGQAGASTAG